MRKIFEKYQTYILIAVGVWALVISIAAFSDSVVLDSGQVIDIPPLGEICQYHAVYCPRGWLPDGSFPIEEQWQQLLDKINDGGLDYPICQEFTFGGSGPCYRLES